MLIRLTDANNKTDVTVQANLIGVAQRTPDNPMVTQIITLLMGPRGPFAFQCTESPSTVQDLVNKAMANEAAMIQGVKPIESASAKIQVAQ